MTVRLEAGMQLGTVRPADVVLPIKRFNADETSTSSDSLPTSSNSYVKTIQHTPERVQRLMEQLNLPLENLSSTEAMKLKKLLEEFSDVFALDDTELGCTDAFRHGINTGDHAPIKQKPY